MRDKYIMVNAESGPPSRCHETEYAFEARVCCRGDRGDISVPRVADVAVADLDAG